MKQRTRLMHNGDDLMSYDMSAKKDDGDLHADIKLHRLRPPEHYIEAQVQEGDTLQAISLRFYCPISELKRINHIDKDNEIFARRTIKVPVTPYSVLTELIPPSQSSETTPSTSNQTYVSLHENSHTPNNNVAGKLPNGIEDISPAIDYNAVVMNSTVAPSVVPFTDTDTTETVTEDTKLLPKKERVSVEAVVVKQLTAQGADFGLKWYHLVCCMLLIGVVVPLIYVMFYLDKDPDDYPPLHSP